MNKRIHFIVTLLCLLLAGAGPASAQDFPSRPITVIVPYAAGGNGDFTARLFADAFGRALNQSVVVDNKAGGGGAIGAGYVANAKPDGYTLLVASKSVFSITPNLIKANYSMQQFRAIGFISRTPMVLIAKKGSKVQNLEDLVAQAKKTPGGLAVGISAMGSDNHASYLQLEIATQTKFNPVGYKGSGPMLQDVLAGSLVAAVDQLTTSKPLIDSGDVIPIAVLGMSPEVSLPGVPTIAKIGATPFDSTTYIGVLTPKDTPAPVVAVLEAALQKALQDPKLMAGLAKPGGAVYEGKRAEWDTAVMKDSQFIEKMIQDGKITRE